MTDKVQKIRAEIERRARILSGTHAGRISDTLQVLEELLSFIDSLQEEQEHFLEDAPATNYEVPKIEAWLAREGETDTQLGYLYLYLHKPIRAEDVGQWIGHNGVIVWNEGKYKALKWEDEPLKVSLSILGDKPKKCMFTKEEFTEEDRKILCEDCEEECEYAKKEEPVSEDLEEAADCYKDMITPEDVDDYEHAYFYETYTEYQIADAFKAGAKWQEKQDQSTIELAEDHAMFAGMEKMKEQMMKNAVDACVIDTKGNYPSLAYGHIDMMFALEDMKVVEGDKVKLIIIKED